MTRRERWAVVRGLVLLGILTALFVAGPAPRLVAKGHQPARVERLNAAPTPSGAEAAYPLNHTFDATGGTAGTPPANHDFEAAGSSGGGTPPANHDFSTAPIDAGVPTNNGFESDFTGWTTAGTTTIQMDTPHGKYAALGSGGAATSSAFAVGAEAQAFAFDVGYLTTSGYSGVKVYALTGTDFTTSTLLGDRYCLACNRWERITLNAVAYRGQTVKLKLERYLGDVSVDAVVAQVVVPSWTVEGTFARVTEADGNAYARLETGGKLTTAAFTVGSGVQNASVRVRGLSTGADQWYVSVLSGPTFATSTQVAVQASDEPDAWRTVSFGVAQWAGQQVKLEVRRQLGTVGLDDAGVQGVSIPNWTTSGTTTLLTGGPTGKYVRTDGQLTSSAFTLAAAVQQLSLAYKGDSAGALFYVELLRGADFSQVVDLGGGQIPADQTQWKTFKAGVQAYAGETVKLRLRRYFGWVLFDTAGVPEAPLPGWTLTTAGAIATGADSNGTFVTSVSGVTGASLRSSTIQSGIIDRTGASDLRFVALSYEVGFKTGDLLEVYWYNSTGQNWKLFQDAADTPTGYRTRYFYVADFMGQAGYFLIRIAGSGKVYSIADNLARQHLAEPFSRKVGLAIDTSTGSFGFQEQDLATGGGLPLTLTRYYAGHSDRLGPLGYRWRHSFETHLVVTTDGDAGVVFGDGREAFFDWSSGTGTFSAADARVHDTLVKHADGTYTFTTTANLAYRFTSAGVLTSVTDQNGNAIALAYDGSGRLTTATAPGNMSFTFTYTAGGRLATATDPTGAVVTYTYDAAGDLVSARDPLGGTRTYTYDQHRLTRVVDKHGQTLVQNTFDSVHRVVSQTDADNKSLTLVYDTPAKGATRVTDPLNAATTYYFDGFHRTTDTTDPTGRTASYAYDAQGNLFTLTDAGSHTWTVAYDTAGNPTTVTDPLNQPLQMTWTAQHRPQTMRDRRGNVTTLVYDAAGNVTQQTDALGKVWTYTYDARQQADGDQPAGPDDDAHV
jgi:YD repeat-containing protein